MWQAVIDMSVSAKYESVKFGVRVSQSVDNFVSSARCQVRAVAKFLETKAFSEPVAEMVRTVALWVMEACSKHE